jgi:hypothetical protein
MSASQVTVKTLDQKAYNHRDDTKLSSCEQVIIAILNLRGRRSVLGRIIQQQPSEIFQNFVSSELD